MRLINNVWVKILEREAEIFPIAEECIKANEHLCWLPSTPLEILVGWFDGS